uniref:SFRICE_028186 n=1 Tax=Spodoptera frugiperda TaxID=7108 RepID=A0A2H1V846_SPOFR
MTHIVQCEVGDEWPRVASLSRQWERARRLVINSVTWSGGAKSYIGAYTCTLSLVASCRLQAHSFIK